jgi:hypothetical protein
MGEKSAPFKKIRRLNNVLKIGYKPTREKKYGF